MKSIIGSIFLLINVFSGVYVTSSVSSPEEIKEAMAAHNRTIHVKDGWIRDPYIIKSPDGYYYLTGTTQPTALKETALNKYNVGLGDSSLVGYELQAWKTKDFVRWESLGVTFTLKDGIWFSSKPEKFKEIPESQWRLWAPEFHFVNNKMVMIHTSPSPVGGANLAVASGIEPNRPWSNPMGAKIGKRHDPSLFQDEDGTWWCTAFYNANVPPLAKDGIQNRDLSANAQTINEQGVTLIPLDVKIEKGELIIRAIDADYGTPGPDEIQKF